MKFKPSSVSFVFEKKGLTFDLTQKPQPACKPMLKGKFKQYDEIVLKEKKFCSSEIVKVKENQVLIVFGILFIL